MRIFFLIFTVKLIFNLPSDINGQPTPVLTSGTLTQVSRKSTVFTAQSLSVSHHHAIQTLISTISIWPRTQFSWPIGFMKTLKSVIQVVWPSTPVKIPNLSWSTAKVNSVIQTPASWQTHRSKCTQWHPANAIASVWLTHSHLFAPHRLPSKVTHSPLLQLMVNPFIQLMSTQSSRSQVSW